MSSVNQFSCCIIGHGKLTVECAELLLEHGFRIEGIVSSFMDLRTWAANNDVESIDPDEDQLEFFSHKNFDYLFSVINPHKISAEIIARPKIAAINYHDAPLPRYAGLHVTSWAIQNLESRFGVTWHEMNAEFDAGAIWVQEVFDLDAEETAFSLNLKCFQKGRDTFQTLLQQIKAGTCRQTPQELAERSVYLSHERPFASAILDWRKSARELAALVRALTYQTDDNPLCTPKVVLAGTIYSVDEAHVISDRSGGTPGEVISVTDQSLQIWCADHALEVSGIRLLTGEPVKLTRDLASAGQILNPLSAELAECIHSLTEQSARREKEWIRTLSFFDPFNLDILGAGPPSNKEALQQLDLGLDEALLNSIAASCSDLSPAEVVPALFCCFLGRLNQGHELDIGVSNSAHFKDSMVAQLFSARLPLQLTLDDGVSVRTLMDSAHSALEKSKQATPFAQDLSARVHSLSRATFPVAIDFVDAFSDENHDGTTLTLEVARSGAMRWRYQPLSLSFEKVSDFIRRFEMFLRSVNEQPERPLKETALLESDERRKLLVTWNQTQKEIENVCIHSLIERQVGRNPEATAVVFRNQSLSYRELNQRANALAMELQRKGARPDSLVGVFAERSIEMVVALLAVQKAGAAYLPLDPEYPRDRIAMMLEDSSASIVLTQSHLVAEVPASGLQIISIDSFDYASAMAGNVSSDVGPENLAYVIYTSGSTGRPKGVMVEHRNVINFMAGMDDALGFKGDPGVWLAVTSISFDISVLEIFWSLARGFKVVIQEDEFRSIGAGVKSSQVDRRMDVGLFYFSSDAGPSSKGDRYRLLMEGAKFADQHGFSTVWTPERHFHLFGGLYPNPSVTSAAVAALTKNISIRAGSIVLPLHNPIRVAEEWSVVDNLSDGRVGFSFASGWHANDFSLKPENFENRKQIMFDGIDTVRRLWKGGSVEVLNGEGQPFEARIYPSPVQSEPPIWITTAGNIETFRAAGEGGFNVLTNLLGQSIEDITAKIDAYREGRKNSGHEGDGNVSVMVHTFVGKDIDEVRETVREPFSSYLKTSFDLVKIAPWAFPAFKQPSKSAAQDSSFDASAFTDEDMAALIDHAFDRYFETAGIFGTPESCVPLIDKLKEAGVDELACLIDFGVDDQLVIDSLPYLNRLKELANPRKRDGGDDYSIAAQIRRHQVTHFQCTPSMARILSAEQDVVSALSSLDKFLLGGEALPRDLAELLAAQLKGDLINVYGPTETTIWSTSTLLASPVKDITIGRPIANTNIYILDHTSQPAPIGMPGELLIGGKGVVRGYWQRPELTAQKFIDNPLEVSDDPIVYRTGDLARYREDGNIEFLGRLDHQVKLRGYRIELGEIESVINASPAVKESVVVTPESPDGTRSLIAYVVPNTSSQASGTQHWAVIWDEAYRAEEAFSADGTLLTEDSSADNDPTLNISGWLDSFSGRQHQQAHMREWVEATVARILSVNPKRVLEVGCGTGMLLYRIAPNCQQYVGIDLSESALDMVAEHAQSMGIDNLKLVQGAIDQIDIGELGQFDLIIVNSVIQYFPSAAYLEQTLQKLAGGLTDHGRIFVGDVRHAGLKRVFDLNVELAKAPATCSAEVLKQRVAERESRDSELLVLPDFFTRIATKLSPHAAVNIQLKRGRFHNEMSMYRYDVWIEISGDQKEQTFMPLDLPEETESLSGLICQQSQPVVIRDVANARLKRHVRLGEIFKNGEFTAAADLALQESKWQGVEPEDLYALDSNMQVEVHWAESGRFDCMDVYVYPKGGAPVNDRSRASAELDLDSLVVEPRHQSHSHDMVDQLKTLLRDNLPEFMIPDDFVVLGALPLTPNGKVDRKALPAPRKREREVVEAFVAPASETEQVIAEVFKEMLNLEKVGTRDNFFNLGANSLLIAQANNRLNQKLDQHVSLVSMYRFPTIAALAANLSGRSENNQSTLKGSDRAEKRKAALGARRKRATKRR